MALFLAFLDSVVHESSESAANLLQEDFVPVLNSSLLLQKVHGHRQSSSRDVRQTEAELVHEGLKRFSSPSDGNDARSARVIDTVVDFINTARVDDIFSAHRRALHGVDD